MRTSKSNWFIVVAAVLGGLGSVLVLLRTATYGVNLASDSAMYISTAQSLVEGRGFTSWSGPYGTPPNGGAAPLYPLLVAIVSFLFDSDIIKTMKYVNAASFGLIVFTIAVWLKTRVRTQLLVIWAICVCVLSISLADISASALTETLFILFSMVSLFALDRFHNTRRHSLLIWAAMSAAAALLTRYAGVTLFATGLLVIGCQKQATWRTRLFDAVIWSGIIIVPFSLWLIRNIISIRAVFGGVIETKFSFLTSIHSASNEVVLWILGPTGLNFLDSLLERYTGIRITGSATESAVILKFAFLALVVVSIWAFTSRFNSLKLSDRNFNMLTCVGFIFSYSLFFVILLPVTNIELSISIRYMIPLVPVLIVVITIVLDESICLRLPGSKMANFAKICTPLLLTLWLLLWAFPNYDSIRSWNIEGRGYRSKLRLDNDVANYINSSRPYDTICSNHPVILYFLMDRYSQTKFHYFPKDIKDAKDNISTYCSDIDDLVVYIWDESLTELTYSLTELGAALEMEILAIFKDGIILRDGVDPVIWDDDFLFHNLVDETKLIIDSHFRVYIDDERDRLIYTRQGRCTLKDIEPKITLHIFPVSSTDLPYTRRYDTIFDDFGFDFWEYAVPIDEHCIAVRSLPEYDIAVIKTGQRIGDDDDSWMGEFTFPDDKIFDHRSTDTR